MHGDILVRASVAEVVSWYSQAMVGYSITASSETAYGQPRSLVGFFARKQLRPDHYFWISNRTLEDSPPGTLRRRLETSNLIELLKRDQTLHPMILNSGPLELYEDHAVDLDHRHFHVRRSPEYIVSITDENYRVISPANYRSMHVPVHNKTDDYWRVEIRRMLRSQDYLSS